MLLALIICHLSVLVAANPFHKYPFVFLLDVGNEELEKTNTEQIRINIPGGSVALRYPAIGNGNTIGHLRVSGIDFGTDLKANIVDGGPGYKYVVLVFMGNPGVPYDAVVTVQTVNDNTFDSPNIGTVVNEVGANEVEEDTNNSAEDLSDDSAVNNNSISEESSNTQISNAELMQSSSNVYKYAQNEVNVDNSDGYDEEIINHDNNEQKNELDNEEQDNDESNSDINETLNESDQKDFHEQYGDNIEQINDPYIQVKGIDADDDDDDDNGNDNNEEDINAKLEQSAAEDYVDKPVSDVSNRVYSQYDNLKSRYSGGEIYYENDEQTISRSDQQEPMDYEDSDEPMFNDGEAHNSYKYKDSNNNNYIDSDDSYAVAY